ncbi:hypothetical protein KQI22_03065 [Kineothrix sp. MSJ-39]|uniref:hypothetical protein n=1 Tax=Kineothrix sp. MSJ-39 TaxID=2841533 RepID=UPI001C11719A|nr:hypothetical protein [Kineothrix sp. MSJ-39]MBU5429048.1 hypothetical protein [Kineothrix sp. MSJ-39]
MKKTSKKLRKLWFIAAMVLLITVFLEPANVKAAQPPTDLQQTGASTRSVELGWTAQSGAYGYIIRYAATPNATTFNYERTTKNEIYIYSLTLGTTYYAQICSVDNYQQYSNYKTYTPAAWSKVIEFNTAPDTISTVTQTNATNNSVTVSWAPVTGATHYLIGIGSTSNEETAQAYGTTTNCSVTLQTQPNVSFYVFVYPVRKSAGAEKFVTTSYNYSSRKCKTVPTAPNNVSIKQRSNNSTYFTWNATSTTDNTDGYELEIKNAKNKKIAKENVSIYSSYKAIYNKKLFTQPFQYRMRAYVEINGQKKYSVWSSMKKYIPGAVPKKIVRASRYATSGKLTWTKVTGATSYTVYWKTSLKGKWKAVAKNVKGTSANVKYNPKSKNNFYYIKANKVKFGKKKYNSSSDSKNLDVYGVIPRY